MTESLLQALVQFIPAPLGAVIIYYIAKEKIKKLDKIDNIENNIQTMIFKLDQLEKEHIKTQTHLDETKKHREEFIILKSEVKAQWRNIDEIKSDLKGLN